MKDKSRRSFLKKGMALAAAAAVVPSMKNTLFADSPPVAPEAPGSSDLYMLPPLPYGYDALEPYIDAQTMQIHHDKHHAGYVSKLNKALGEVSDASIDKASLEDLFRHHGTLPAAVNNNAGGHWNHSLFWTVMKPSGGGKPGGIAARMIDESFGSFENMQKAFNDAALGVFGSGWAWLTVFKGKLAVASTPNQDNPLMQGGMAKGLPVLGLDVWEHAYYLKYQNRRAEYVQAWWNVVNWDEVDRRLVRE